MFPHILISVEITPSHWQHPLLMHSRSLTTMTTFIITLYTRNLHVMINSTYVQKSLQVMQKSMTKSVLMMLDIKWCLTKNSPEESGCYSWTNAL